MTGYKPEHTVGSTVPLIVPHEFISDDLIDENDLLEADDYVKPAQESLQAGCAPTKKACKDCSCGRAEAEE